MSFVFEHTSPFAHKHIINFFTVAVSVSVFFVVVVFWFVALGFIFAFELLSTFLLLRMEPTTNIKNKDAKRARKKGKGTL